MILISTSKKGFISETIKVKVNDTIFPIRVIEEPSLGIHSFLGVGPPKAMTSTSSLSNNHYSYSPMQ